MSTHQNVLKLVVNINDGQGISKLLIGAPGKINTEQLKQLIQKQYHALYPHMPSYVCKFLYDANGYLLSNCIIQDILQQNDALDAILQPNQSQKDCNALYVFGNMEYYIYQQINEIAQQNLIIDDINQLVQKILPFVSYAKKDKQLFDQILIIIKKITQDINFNKLDKYLQTYLLGKFQFFQIQEALPVSKKSLKSSDQIQMIIQDKKQIPLFLQKNQNLDYIFDQMLLENPNVIQLLPQLTSHLQQAQIQYGLNNGIIEKILNSSIKLDSIKAFLNRFLVSEEERVKVIEDDFYGDLFWESEQQLLPSDWIKDVMITRHKSKLIKWLCEKALDNDFRGFLKKYGANLRFFQSLQSQNVLDQRNAVKGIINISMGDKAFYRDNAIRLQEWLNLQNNQVDSVVKAFILSTVNLDVNQ